MYMSLLSFPVGSPDFLVRRGNKSEALVEVKPVFEMFNTEKYKEVNFNRHSVLLMSPTTCLTIKKNSLHNWHVEHDPLWIRAQNLTRFTPPIDDRMHRNGTIPIEFDSKDDIGLAGWPLPRAA